MSNDVAIRVEGLSKAWRIGLAEQRHETVISPCLELTGRSGSSIFLT